MQQSMNSNRTSNAATTARTGLRGEYAPPWRSPHPLTWLLLSRSAVWTSGTGMIAAVSRCFCSPCERLCGVGGQFGIVAAREEAMGSARIMALVLYRLLVRCACAWYGARLRLCVGLLLVEIPRRKEVADVGRERNLSVVGVLRNTSGQALVCAPR